MSRLPRHAVSLVLALLAGALVPAKAQACMTGGPAWTDAQIDEKYRRDLEQLPELFEAEVLRADGANYEMRVLRVFRGRLYPGMILSGRPSVSSCMGRGLQAGDRGFALVGFGPNGPRFVTRFLNDIAVESLRRIGALPAQ